MNEVTPYHVKVLGINEKLYIGTPTSEAILKIDLISARACYKSTLHTMSIYNSIVIQKRPVSLPYTELYKPIQLTGPRRILHYQRQKVDPT